VFVDRDEVGRAKSGKQLGFPQKLVYRKAAFGLPDFDRDLTFHVNVRREKDFSLRSAAQAPLNLISFVQNFADHSLVTFSSERAPR
jgi:hypothetical protein